MATITLTIDQVPGELRAFPARTREAAIMAARRTVLIDGPRWVQWSIRGGGAAGAEPPRATATAEEIKRAKGRRTPQTWQTKLKKVVGKILGGNRPQVRSARPKTPRRPPAPSAGYRVPIDTGDYANSWVAEPTETGAILYSASSPPIKAGVIELGRRPGRGIPIEPLADWVRRKLSVQDPEEARGIAIRISWKHKRHGRPGLHVLARAHPKIAEAAVRNLERQLRVNHAKAAQLYASRARLERSGGGA